MRERHAELQALRRLPDTGCAALQVCKEAEITEIAKESDEQVKTEYLTMSTNM